MSRRTSCGSSKKSPISEVASCRALGTIGRLAQVKLMENNRNKHGFNWALIVYLNGPESGRESLRKSPKRMVIKGWEIDRVGAIKSRGKAMKKWQKKQKKGL